VWKDSYPMTASLAISARTLAKDRFEIGRRDFCQTFVKQGVTFCQTFVKQGVVFAKFLAKKEAGK